MPIVRIALLTVIAFILAAVAGYLLVAVGFFAAWEVMGIKDRDGGGAMAVGFVFAPAGALIFGIVGAIYAFVRLRRRQKAEPKTEVALTETRLLLRLGAALLGLVVGWQVANALRYLLMSLVHQHIAFAVIFAFTHWVLPMAFALAGFFLFGRRRQG